MTVAPSGVLCVCNRPVTVAPPGVAGGAAESRAGGGGDSGADSGESDRGDVAVDGGGDGPAPEQARRRHPRRGHAEGVRGMVHGGGWGRLGVVVDDCGRFGMTGGDFE